MVPPLGWALVFVGGEPSDEQVEAVVEFGGAVEAGEVGGEAAQEREFPGPDGSRWSGSSPPG